MKLSAVIVALLVLSIPVVHAAELQLQYDANGNLVSGDGKYRVYNSLNQLSAIYNGSDSSGLLLEEYSYHPLEERILVKKVYNNDSTLKETVRYLSQTFVQAENGSETQNFTYVHHNGQLVAQQANGTTLFIHGNHEGSSSVVTNAPGSVVENTTYAPFGEAVNGGSSIRFGYEGKEHDSVVGDTDFHFRKYKPEWGLFVKPDAVVQDVYSPQDFNHYVFERNNPYRYIDPTGKDAWLVLAPDQAGGQGHVALVIGNEDTGYRAYTQGAADEPAGLPRVFSESYQGGVYITPTYDTPEGALGHINRPNQPYTRAVHFRTTTSEDLAMHKAGATLQQKYENGEIRYHVLFNNCADFTTDVLHAGNVMVREGNQPILYTARASTYATWRRIMDDAKDRYKAKYGSGSTTNKGKSTSGSSASGGKNK